MSVQMSLSFSSTQKIDDNLWSFLVCQFIWTYKFVLILLLYCSHVFLSLQVIPSHTQMQKSQKYFKNTQNLSQFIHNNVY